MILDVVPESLISARVCGSAEHFPPQRDAGGWPRVLCGSPSFRASLMCADVGQRRLYVKWWPVKLHVPLLPASEDFRGLQKLEWLWMAEGVCHWEMDLRFSLQSQQWRLQQEKQHRKEPSALPLNHVTRTGRQYWNMEAPSRPGRSWRFFLYEQTTGLTALEGRRGTFVSHRGLLERADSLFSLQRCCWRATAKNPATF